MGISKSHTFVIMNYNIDGIDILKLLIEHASQIAIPKGQIFRREGELNRNVIFLQSGVVRCYKQLSEFEQKTFMIRWYGQFIASHEAVFFDQPSTYCWEAMEHSEGFEIDSEILNHLYKNNSEVITARANILKMMLQEAMTRVETFIFQTPEQRYKEIFDLNPEVISQIPDKYIASMIGVTLVTVSRIRKRISTRKSL